MDPLTQGVLGAALPQATYAGNGSTRKYQIAIAGALGMLGGMAADLDVLIRSNTDPLLFLVYHRQFTHSLAFIPIGGLIVGFVLHWVLGRRWQLRFWQTVLLCSLGYATHALLDTATSYGTMLLWPFVDTRYALNIISVVDPLFTVPLALSVLWAAVRGRPGLARIGLVWALLYLGAGWWQHQTAREMAIALADSRGHNPVRLEVKPSFGNIVVWKSIYEVDGTFHVDAIRPRIASAVIEGDSVRKLDTARDFPWLSPESQQARDIDRFVHFSDGYAAVDPANASRVIDARYSFVPNEISALFSIELAEDARPSSHVRYVSHRERAREQFGRLWHLIAGWVSP
ncbi:MAG: metal-dependent hydrolase [Rhodospirillales bacterium]|nr:metal-dependent hydrolase [Rhodospirillales bacterium]MBO6786066.1 metal-dependent hydrolase [Rhodospirillales bacterium]